MKKVILCLPTFFLLFGCSGYYYNGGNGGSDNGGIVYFDNPPEAEAGGEGKEIGEEAIIQLADGSYVVKGHFRGESRNELLEEIREIRRRLDSSPNNKEKALLYFKAAQVRTALGESKRAKFNREAASHYAKLHLYGSDPEFYIERLKGSRDNFEEIKRLVSVIKPKAYLGSDNHTRTLGEMFTGEEIIGDCDDVIFLLAEVYPRMRKFEFITRETPKITVAHLVGYLPWQRKDYILSFTQDRASGGGELEIARVGSSTEDLGVIFTRIANAFFPPESEVTIREVFERK